MFWCARFWIEFGSPPTSRECHDEDVKLKPECAEGPAVGARFDALARKVFSVPHEEIGRRETEYKRLSALSPHRRGPKPKAT
jgi:hypothetical protein